MVDLLVQVLPHSSLLVIVHYVFMSQAGYLSSLIVLREEKKKRIKPFSWLNG